MNYAIVADEMKSITIEDMNYWYRLLYPQAKVIQAHMVWNPAYARTRKFLTVYFASNPGRLSFFDAVHVGFKPPKFDWKPFLFDNSVSKEKLVRKHKAEDYDISAIGLW